MGDYRLKIKIGDHEFEADGPAEAVQSQFQAFKDMISNLPKQKDTTNVNDQGSEKNPPSDSPVSLDKIMHLDGRIVSLTAIPPDIEDAVLVIMLGQRNARNNEAVTGSELMDGLVHSGIRVPRVDRVMDRLASTGFVIRIGAHRGTRYRLTNQGMARAQNVARDLAGMVP